VDVKNFLLGICYNFTMPGENKKLDEIYQLVRSNNKMLRSLKRQAFWGRVFKIIIYAILLGIPVYLYLTIFQPILAELLDTYSQIQQVGGQLQETTNAIPTGGLQGLLNSIPGVNFGAQ